MTEPSGQVISLSYSDGPNSVLRATVAVNDEIYCRRCAAGKGCGAGLLGRGKAERRVEAIVAPGLDVQSGDIVSLGMQPGRVLQAAAIVYGVPLLAGVLAAITAYGFGATDPGTAVAALCGLTGGMFAARARLRTLSCRNRVRPTVTAVTS